MEAAFLQAIADNFADETARLVYADWLEEQGDARAEFLRVQHGLAHPSGATYRRLCKRERELLKTLDASWIQLVRRFTTPSPCCDLGQLVPALRPLARTATRLHPHRVAVALPAWVSKIGGAFLWPADEPWPTCAECNVDLAPILQLTNKAVPDIAFPIGKDLLQLFWCPNGKEHGNNPLASIWWRAQASITGPRSGAPGLSGFPRPSSSASNFVPFECSVHPEQVREYPLGNDLRVLVGAKEAARIGKRIQNAELGPARDRFAAHLVYASQSLFDAPTFAAVELGQCPGSKVGGKPSMVQDGRTFDHLVTLSNREFDSIGFRRWLAVEDQRILALPGKALARTRFDDVSDVRALQEPLGIGGRNQRVHVFVCRATEPWQVVAYVGN